MTEEFLSFLWKYRLYHVDDLCLDGEKVEVIYPGEWNRDSGPDFFNAKLKLGGTIWVGNVEIHTKATDWNRHDHDASPAFDNVILHIVGLDDLEVYTSKGRKVPTVVLPFEAVMLKNYDTLMSAEKWIPCADNIRTLDAVVITSLLGKTGVERLEQRGLQIASNLDQTIDNWEEALYRQLARSYGFHVNSQPFEALAKSIPYYILKKYSHDIERQEAILFGQAGLLLDDYSHDDYYNQLKKEYHFQRTKYNFKPVESHLWKFMRLRPGNFPTVRIAQFAALMSHHPSLFSVLLECEKVNDVLKLLSVDVSDYWRNHYTFGNQSRPVAKPLGTESAKIITMNTIAPFYFMYGKKMGLQKYQDKAMIFLEELDAEENSIITQWKQLGVKPQNAFESQALLHLKNDYCDKKLCLDCQIGVKIISRG
jgi:hypothetical protein